MKHKLLFILLLFTTQSNAENSNIEAMEKADSWLYNAFQEINDISSETILKIAPVQNITTHDVKIGHASNPLESWVINYEGLELFAIIETIPDGKVFITKYTIKNNKWTLNNGLRPGAPVSLLNELPVQLTKTPKGYCGMNNCVKVHDEAGIITELEVTLYFD